MSWLRVDAAGLEWVEVRPNVELHLSCATFRVRCTECRAGETWGGLQWASADTILGVLDEFAAKHQHAVEADPGGIGEGAL